MSEIPTPTQAENDAIKLGEMHPDEKSGGSAPAVDPPTVVDIPSVSGTGTVGEQLACTMGNWTGEPSAYAYAWQSDGTPNSATGSTYNAVPGDVGHAVSCVVTATNAAGSTDAPPSNAITITAAGTTTAAATRRR